ncbi:MAG TPA: hypothetical protein VGC04_15025, partial [Cellulomonas sp.]
PTIFVSGGPMEAGKAVVADGVAATHLNLINAINYSTRPSASSETLSAWSRPTPAPRAAPAPACSPPTP